MELSQELRPVASCDLSWAKTPHMCTATHAEQRKAYNSHGSRLPKSLQQLVTVA